MSASQIGAYQSAAYAFTQQATSGAEQARAAAAQEAPAFPHTEFGVSTRAAVSSTDKPNKPQPRAANSEGRGKLVDILA